MKRCKVNQRGVYRDHHASFSPPFCLIWVEYGRLNALPYELQPLNSHLTLGASILLAILIVLLGGALVLRRRQTRRGNSLNNLLDLADRLEADLKTCRSSLQQAHAVMSLNPDLPAASEQEAQHAIDAGLRALLQQRLWIRDRSPTASQQELDQALDSMRGTRDRLQPLLGALNKAQRDLDSAMREHIRCESDT